ERGWWRGLDSNQRTLARADLQSAAFNHSATSPRGEGAPCGGAGIACQRGEPRRVVSPTLRSERSGRAACGAGEGNRTLVVSLEGFCSTIELHPPAGTRTRQMTIPPAIVNRRQCLT